MSVADHNKHDTTGFCFLCNRMVGPERGEQCVYCGKDARTCEHFKPDEQENDARYRSRDEGRNPDGSGESYAERNI